MSTMLPEKELLKCMLVSFENIKVASELVKDHYFSLPQALNLSNIIKFNCEEYQSLLTSQDLPRLFALSERLTDSDKQSVTQLMMELEMIPDPNNIYLIIDTVVRDYKKRELAKIVDKCITLAKDNRIDEALDTTISSFSAIKDETLRKIGISGELPDLMHNHCDQMRAEVATPELFRGLPLGFPEFDREMGGLKKQTLSILYSDAKMGKSLLLLYIARSVASAGKNVLFHLNEGGAGLLLNRLVCFENPVTQSVIRDRALTQEEINKFEEVLNKTTYMPHIMLDDQSSVNSSVTRLRNLIKTYLLIKPLDLLVIDMMTNMDAEIKGKDRYEELGYIAQKLKDLATEFNIAIITSMHVNTEGQKSKGDVYQVLNLGLSREPAKHVDNMLSWRIKEHEDFLLTSKGVGCLTLTIARNAAGTQKEININTSLISIQEAHKNMYVGGSSSGK